MKSCLNIVTESALLCCCLGGVRQVGQGTSPASGCCGFLERGFVSRNAHYFSFIGLKKLHVTKRAPVQIQRESQK